MAAEKTNQWLEVIGGLLNELECKHSPENIKAITTVLDFVKNCVNDRWERHLDQESNRLLTSNRVVCPSCSFPIYVQRTFKSISVEWDDSNIQ